MQFEISPHATRAEARGREMWGRAVKSRGLWRVKENHQWWLLVKQKLWGAVTNGDLTIYSTLHFGAELQLRRLIVETMALKTSGGFYMDRTPCCGCGEHPQEGEKNKTNKKNHCFFSLITLLSSTILRRLLFIRTGMLMSLVGNSTLQMAAVGGIKYKYH